MFSYLLVMLVERQMKPGDPPSAFVPLSHNTSFPSGQHNAWYVGIFFSQLKDVKNCEKETHVWLLQPNPGLIGLLLLTGCCEKGFMFTLSFLLHREPSHRMRLKGGGDNNPLLEKFLSCMLRTRKDFLITNSELTINVGPVFLFTVSLNVTKKRNCAFGAMFL